MNDSTNSGPAPGWYRDPAMPGRLRWWDGSAWTGQTREPAAPPAPTASAPVPTAAGASGAPQIVPDPRPVAVPHAAAALQQQQAAAAPPRPVAPPAAAVAVAPSPAPLAASPAPLSGAPVLPSAPQQAPVLAAVPSAPAVVPDAVSQPSAPAVPGGDPVGDPFALMAAATGSIKVIPPAPQQLPEPDPDPGKRGRLGLILGLAAAILVVTGGIAFLLIDPLGLFPQKSSTDYSDKVELALKASIEATAEGDVTVESVTCPDALEPRQAEEFPCDVVLGDGSTLEIVAHGTEDGTNIQWTPADA